MFFFYFHVDNIFIPVIIKSRRSQLTTEEIINDIFNQAENGVVKIGDETEGVWSFYPRFYTIIKSQNNVKNSKYPVLQIPNYRAFVRDVEEYLSVAQTFYKADSSYFGLSGANFSKKLFLDLIINASSSDLVNINNYIKTQTSILKDSIKCGKFILGFYNGLKITGKITKNHSNLESPYLFDIVFSDDNQDTFKLPSIYFGFESSKVYIMAIQNLNKQPQNNLSKKLDRYFRKVNKDVPTDDIISNVSPNSLVSLTIFLSYCSQLNKTEIIAPSFRPIRYHSSKVSGYKQSKSADAKYKFLDKHNKNQYNITNKFMYLFLRYEFHFPNCETIYADTTQKMYLKLSNNKINQSNNIINEIAQSVKNQNEKQKVI